jgi:hypothetical protein
MSATQVRDRDSYPSPPPPVYGVDDAASYGPKATQDAKVNTDALAQAKTRSHARPASVLTLASSASSDEVVFKGHHHADTVNSSPSEMHAATTHTVPSSSTSTLVEDLPSTTTAHPDPELGTENGDPKRKCTHKPSLTDRICGFIFAVILGLTLLAILMGVCYALLSGLKREAESVQQQREEERKQLEDFRMQQELFKGFMNGFERGR